MIKDDLSNTIEVLCQLFLTFTDQISSIFTIYQMSLFIDEITKLRTGFLEG
jgi:hypothetical protein